MGVRAAKTLCGGTAQRICHVYTSCVRHTRRAETDDRCFRRVAACECEEQHIAECVSVPVVANVGLQGLTILLGRCAAVYNIIWTLKGTVTVLFNGPIMRKASAGA
eukprot:SAG11_NODE_1149_length_5682_cov_5.991401_4_plen_106_part_00